MLSKHVTLLRAANFLVDVGLALLMFVTADAAYHLVRGSAASAHQHPYLTAVVVIWGTLYLLRSDGYSYRLKTYSGLLKETAIISAYGAVLLLLAAFVLRLPLLPRSQFIGFIMLTFAAQGSLRLMILRLLHTARRRGRSAQQTLVIGTRDRSKRVIDTIAQHPHWGVDLVGVVLLDPPTKLYRYRDVPLLGGLDSLASLLTTRHIDNVVFALPLERVPEIREAARLCETSGVSLTLHTDLLDLRSSSYRIGEFDGKPLVIYTRARREELATLAKETFDRGVALIGLAIGAPLLIGIAALVRLTSRGPALFRQERCGLNGRRFQMLKFRTMVEQAEQMKSELTALNEMDGPVFKMKSDPRITPLGRALRRLSLDELPQLINVLCGEMSLVGPRPPLPDEVRAYDLWQRRKLSVKPGLTCLWQVGKRNDTSFDDWMRQDLEYIDNWSLWLDAKVLARTIPTILKATGR